MRAKEGPSPDARRWECRCRGSSGCAEDHWSTRPTLASALPSSQIQISSEGYVCKEMESSVARIVEAALCSGITIDTRGGEAAELACGRLQDIATEGAALKAHPGVAGVAQQACSALEGGWP